MRDFIDEYGSAELSYGTSNDNDNVQSKKSDCIGGGRNIAASGSGHDERMERRLIPSVLPVSNDDVVDLLNSDSSGFLFDLSGASQLEEHVRPHVSSLDDEAGSC